MIQGVYFKNIKSNILLLLKLQKDDFLLVKEGGLLEKVDKGFRKNFYQSANRLLFNKLSIKVMRTIISTFTVFLHEMKNPIEIGPLKLTYEKSLEFANRALKQIEYHERYHNIIKILKKIMRSYQEGCLRQIKIIEDIELAVEKSIKYPNLIFQDSLAALEKTKPTKTKGGASGAYLMFGVKRGISGVFKPFDEEIGAPNNPLKREYRGFLGSKLYGYSTIVGRGVFREVAAYKISSMLKLDIVPETTFAKFTSDRFYKTTEGKFLREKKEKLGSLQEYCAGYKHFYELTRSDLEIIPVDQLHRIFVLDVIIGNLDRNFGNLLTNGSKIIAIDHALSMISRHKKLSIDALREIPQFNVALFGSLKEKVLSISSDKLKNKLRKECMIEENCLDLMNQRISILQESVRLNMDVGSIIVLFDPLHQTSGKSN
jgi:hypothetical protein